MQLSPSHPLTGATFSGACAPFSPIFPNAISPVAEIFAEAPLGFYCVCFRARCATILRHSLDFAESLSLPTALGAITPRAPVVPLTINRIGNNTSVFLTSDNFRLIAITWSTAESRGCLDISLAVLITTSARYRAR